MKCMELKADLESLKTLQDFVSGEIRSANPSHDLSQDIKLVLEEVFTNIVFYAYPHSSGTVQVSCFHQQKGLFCIEFRDAGIPFDPTEFRASDLSRDLADRAIGGLGIHLVRQLARSMRYERDGESNVLTVCFSI